MYDISICNLQQSVKLDKELLEQVIRDALSSEQVAAADVSVAVVDDERMQQLNRTHLGHDYPTDVLSFLLDCDAGPHEPGEGRARMERRGAGKRLEGELIISAETAERQAREFGWRTGDELLLYAAHGVLHLCGYTDSDEAERQRMRRREADILKIRGLTPHYELTVR